MILKNLFKDSAIYGAADFFTKIISFFSFPIIASTLAPADFGILELVFSLTALIGLFVNCGINNSVQRFYWDSSVTESVRINIISTGFGVIVLFGLFTIFLGAVVLKYVYPYIVDHQLSISISSLIAALCIMFFNQCIQFVLDVIRLHFAPYKYFALALVFRGGAVSAGLIAIVVLHQGINGLLLAQAIILSVIMPFAIYFIKNDLNLSSLSFKWFKDLVYFGFPFIFVGIAYWVFGSMDRWMLASMTSIEEVGVYSVAFRFASIVLFFSLAFGKAWSPFAIKIRTDHPDKYRQVYGEVLLILIFVMLLVGGGVAMFSGEIISLIMPVEYSSSALPLLVLCFAVILQSTQQVTAIGISLEKKTHLFAYLAWVAAIVNLVFNWILIPYFGAAGAAIATLISYALISSSYLYYTQKLHPIYVSWNKLFIFLLISAFVALISYVLMSQSFSFELVTLKIIVSLCFIVIGWFLLPIKSIKRV